MAPLIDHARRELQVSGVGAKSPHGEEIARDVLALITLFTEQGHRGSSGMVASLFYKLSKLEPLSPLSGTNSEWVVVGPNEFQNIRCPRVCRINGVEYDTHGIIWEDPDGSRYVNTHSSTPITFPYTPSSVVKPSSDDPGRQPYTP